MTNLPRHINAATLKAMVTPAMQSAMKSPQQGAATTVWAAIGKEWERKGGKYLEDCSESEPDQSEGGKDLLRKGYAKHIYDQTAAEQLWNVSMKLVGLE